MAAPIRERTRSSDHPSSPLLSTPCVQEKGLLREYSYIVTATGQALGMLVKNSTISSPLDYASKITELSRQGKRLHGRNIYQIPHTKNHHSILKITTCANNYFSPPLGVEVDIHEALLKEKVPNIPLLKKAFCSPPILCSSHREIAILMEYTGEDCFELYLKKSNQLPSLPQLRNHLNYWLPTLSFMHKKGWIHRDIKPENLTKHHLIDFDKSIKPIKNQSYFFPDGTPRYLAPEALRKEISFSEKSDSFSLGLTLYLLFTHKHFTEEIEESYFNPYHRDHTRHLKLLEKKLTTDLEGVKEEIRTRGVSLEEDEDSVELFIDLLEKLLKLDPEERLSCKDALSHPFIKEYVHKSSSSSSSASSSSKAA